jgi:hypothetical protein
MDKIRKEKALSDALTADLKAAVTEFKQTYKIISAMPSTRDIRRRIKSVKNTAQITKAMQMVAASKMRKAQQAALAGRPYANLMNEVLGALVGGAGISAIPSWKSAR